MHVMGKWEQPPLSPFLWVASPCCLQSSCRATCFFKSHVCQDGGTEVAQGPAHERASLSLGSARPTRPRTFSHSDTTLPRFPNCARLPDAPASSPRDTGLPRWSRGQGWTRGVFWARTEEQEQTCQVLAKTCSSRAQNLSSSPSCPGCFFELDFTGINTLEVGVRTPGPPALCPATDAAHLLPGPAEPGDSSGACLVSMST